MNRKPIAALSFGTGAILLLMAYRHLDERLPFDRSVRVMAASDVLPVMGFQRDIAGQLVCAKSTTSGTIRVVRFAGQGGRDETIYEYERKASNKIKNAAACAVEFSPDGRFILLVADWLAHPHYILTDLVLHREVCRFSVRDSVVQTKWMANSAGWLSVESRSGQYVIVTYSSGGKRTSARTLKERGLQHVVGFSQAGNLIVLSAGANAPVQGFQLRSLRLSDGEILSSPIRVEAAAAGRLAYAVASPDGRKLALVYSEWKQPTLIERLLGRGVDDIRETQTMWVSDGNGKRTRQVGRYEFRSDSDLIVSLQWSVDGSSLLYYRGDALWEMPTS